MDRRGWKIMDKTLNRVVSNGIKDVLFHNSHIEVRKSSIHGYGVFAKENINEGDLLEEAYYINVKHGRNVNSYKFKLPLNGNGKREYAIPLGFGCIYNTSSNNTRPNADWYIDLDNNIYIYKAIKKIKKDEEIITDYYNSIL
jgi:SET domain-containing protein